MRIVYRLFIASILTVVFMQNSTASPTDFIDNDTYTTDKTTGLDWLDVTTSINQSYNYVSGQFGSGGAYEGWRYATELDFHELAFNYTGLTVDSSIGVTYGDEIVGLQKLLGVTYDLSAVEGHNTDTRGIIADQSLPLKRINWLNNKISAISG